MAQDFWDAVSPGVQDRRVMFELWNEPVYEEDELLLSDPDGSKQSLLKPYFEDLISTIRDNGNQSIVFATGNHWAYNLKGIKDDPLSDPNPTPRRRATSTRVTRATTLPGGPPR